MTEQMKATPPMTEATPNQNDGTVSERLAAMIRRRAAYIEKHPNAGANEHHPDTIILRRLERGIDIIARQEGVNPADCY